MILLLFLIISLFPVNFEIKTDKKTVKLGEVFNAEIKVLPPEGIKIKGLEKLSEEIHIFGYKISKNSIKVKLGAYNLGKIKIPLKIYFMHKNKPRELNIPAFTINVSSSTKSISNINPIKDVKGYFNYMYVVIFLVLLLVLYVHLRKKNYVYEKRDFISVEEWFSRRLKEIKDTDYPSKAKFKEYYDALSDALREYIQKKYSIKTMELTTDELFRVLKDNFPNSIYLNLRGIFTECDWIKFSPVGRKPESIERVFEEIKGLVKDGL